MKSVFFASGVAAYALFVSLSGEALASPSACTISGVVEGGGLYDWQNSDVSLGSPTQIKANSNWLSGFGEGAVGVNCDNLNVQADGALYAFWASASVPQIPTNEDVNLTVRQGHIGGAAFIRDPNSYTLGVSGSWITQNYLASSKPTDLVSGESSGNLWRVGGFAEYYASDSFTLAASAHYFSGSLPEIQVTSPVPEFDQSGFELAAIAKFYPTNDLSLTARADILRSTLRVANTADFDFNGYAISFEGEYLMPDTQLSIFAGGRYADRLISLFNPVHMDFQDTQVYTGLKFAFGGQPSRSIAARDRSGSYDNTSVFLEKLPNMAASVDNTFVNAFTAAPPPP